MLNSWIENIDEYKKNFLNGKPFENVVINNFFNDDIANKLLNNFPLPSEDNKNWNYYRNPIEHKYSLNNFEEYPEIKKIFEYMQTDEFISIIRQITGIDDLEADPYLHGAGLHAYPKNGKLDIHLDYNIHPITQKERRVNLIIYLNNDWKPEYGGYLKLYDTNFNETTEINEISMPNTAVLFKTCDISYHGLPEPIKCPDGTFRKSIAIYYVSKPRDNLTQRYKAEFFPTLNQKVNDNLKKLYEIRKTRLLTNEDLNEYPNWENDGYF